MTNNRIISRRAVLAGTAAASLARWARASGKLPVGLELFSVRDELKKDPMATVAAVAKIGYAGVEFFSPYFAWTPEYAKEMRKHLDELGIVCFSTHNGMESFRGDGVQHAAELNTILGSKFVVLASAGRIQTLDGWKQVAATLNETAEKIRPQGLRTGYHNHQLEFTPLDGKRPIEVLAANTGKDVMLQLDVGTCIEAGSDPVAWINQNPGRIRALHLKDWAPGPEKGYKVLFGEGSAHWKDILAAATSTGGAEYVLIEQEGSRFPELETAKRCLDNYRELTA